MSTTRFEYCIDGPWTMALDPEDVGTKKRWYTGKCPGEARDVKVPGFMTQAHTSAPAWYFCDFELEQTWEGLETNLEFMSLDYSATVWLNGKRLGKHEGGCGSVVLPANDAVKKGKNSLALRITGNGDRCARGITGSVRLTAKPITHISDIAIQPDIRRKRLVVNVSTSSPEPVEVRLQIESTPYEIQGEAGSLVLPFPEYELWSSDNPQLYNLVCELLDKDEVIDRVETRFGMREFTVKDNRFYLNLRPISVKAISHRPYYADAVSQEQMLDFARKELNAAKSAGFNMVRLDLDTAPDMFFDAADEMGMMIYSVLPLAAFPPSRNLKESCIQQIRKVVQRDRNRPSVVVISSIDDPFAGETDNALPPHAYEFREDFCEFTRALDPTRVIMNRTHPSDMDSGLSRLYRPYHEEALYFDDITSCPPAPFDKDTEQHFMHCGDPSRLFFWSRLGSGTLPDSATLSAIKDQVDSASSLLEYYRKLLQEIQSVIEEFGLGMAFKDADAFTQSTNELQCEAVRCQIEALRANPKIDGYCYAQLCDAGSNVSAGIIDNKRKPKDVFKTFKKILAPARLLLHAPKTNLQVREEIPVNITLTGSAQLKGFADLSLQVIGPTNQVLWKKKRAIKLARGGKAIWSGRISASGSTGHHRFVARIMRTMSVLAQGELDLHVVDAMPDCDVKTCVLGNKSKWREACAKLAPKASVLAPVHIVPPLASTIRAYPDNELVQTLAQAKSGAVVIVFDPPEDWNDLADMFDPALRATSRPVGGGNFGCYHFAKMHPVFEDLPTRGLMSQAYANVLAQKTFVEKSDETICGVLDARPQAKNDSNEQGGSWWGNDILVKRYGSGRLVFTHMQILQNLGYDPVADRIFINMLNHFSSHSVPADEPALPDKAAIEWLRKERTGKVRRWMIIGPFENWEDKGHETVYPPEKEIKTELTYPGWYCALKWRDSFSLEEDGHLVRVQNALTPSREQYHLCDYGVAYAYAEFTSDRRYNNIRLVVKTNHKIKLWMNGRMVYKDDEPRQDAEVAVETYVRQGRNTVLLKLSKTPGPFQFTASVETAKRHPLPINWFK